MYLYPEFTVFMLYKMTFLKASFLLPLAASIFGLLSFQPFLHHNDKYQRWSPRGRPWPQGQILKSLASKVKSLASRPQVLENWPVLGSKTAVFFELLKFCEELEKFFGKRFLVEIA